MQFGVCGHLPVADVAAKAGYDFCEWSVGALLKPREPREAFLAALAEIRTAALPYPVLSSFVPGDLKITGPDADPYELRKYVTTAFDRAEEAGVEVIVFGSGVARYIPDGFDRADAHDQIAEFCSMMSPVAQGHGVTIAVEPLCRAETNVLNTVGECAALVREVAHPAFRLLVDAYHFLLENDSCDDLIANGHLLSHVHIATATNRLAPAAEPCDFAPFFAALAKGGYDGRVSIEAKIESPESDLPGAIELMRGLAEAARAD